MLFFLSSRTQIRREKLEDDKALNINKAVKVWSFKEIKSKDETGFMGQGFIW